MYYQMSEVFPFSLIVSKLCLSYLVIGLAFSIPVYFDKSTFTVQESLIKDESAS